ncbi:MAG: hypothetical protein KDB22_23335 [Planctomycetales bacterium]|nr:hypothetical protein [Planctomycetales bacterium]
MQKLVKLFSAFCVATVLAQVIIVALAAARGNIKQDTVVKAIALLNGVDFVGDGIEQALINSREAPMPSYEDIEEERARLDKNLELRETAIAREKELTQIMLAELQAKDELFTRRTTEFYEALDRKEKVLQQQGLQDLQLTLESLSPEQAKDQIVRFLSAGRLDDVVAIFKGMAPDKRKKIMGEFVDQQDAEDLHMVLERLGRGEPNVGLIRNARDSSPAGTSE